MAAIRTGSFSSVNRGRISGSAIVSPHAASAFIADQTTCRSFASARLVLQTCTVRGDFISPSKRKAKPCSVVVSAASAACEMTPCDLSPSAARPVSAALRMPTALALSPSTPPRNSPASSTFSAATARTIASRAVGTHFHAKPGRQRLQRFRVSPIDDRSESRGPNRFITIGRRSNDRVAHPPVCLPRRPRAWAASPPRLRAPPDAGVRLAVLVIAGESGNCCNAVGALSVVAQKTKAGNSPPTFNGGMSIRIGELNDHEFDRASVKRFRSEWH